MEFQKLGSKELEYKEYWEEGMDEKRFALCMAKRVWIILAAALAGALFAGGMYLMVRLLTQGPTQYQAEVRYACLLYTSDAGDAEHSVEPGGRFIINNISDFA